MGNIHNTDIYTGYNIAAMNLPLLMFNPWCKCQTLEVLLFYVYDTNIRVMSLIESSCTLTCT